MKKNIIKINKFSCETICSLNEDEFLREIDLDQKEDYTFWQSSTQIKKTKLFEFGSYLYLIIIL